MDAEQSKSLFFLALVAFVIAAVMHEASDGLVQAFWLIAAVAAVVAMLRFCLRVYGGSSKRHGWNVPWWNEAGERRGDERT